MPLTLPDPLAAAPFKVPPGTSHALRTWLEGHAWPIRVVPMTAAHAQAWDLRVQPTVQRIELERLVGLRPHEPPRADAYWRFSWRQVHRAFSVVRRLVVRGAGTPAALSEAHLYAIEADDANDDAIPIGMMLGLTRFPFPAPGTPGVPPMTLNGLPARAVFAWQITAAPADTLSASGIAPNLQLGRTLLDTVIQVSLASGHFGWTLLHADPHGGAELMRFYTGSSMLSLPQADYPAISSRRSNDGRYFYLTPSVAGAFTGRFARLRASVRGAARGTAPIVV